jgi:hypothetical protein
MHRRQSYAFRCQRLTDDVLQEAIARCHDPACINVMHEGLKYKNRLCRNARGLLGFLHQSHPLSPVTGSVAVEGQDPLLLRMTRLLENGRGRFTVAEPWVMLLQDVPDASDTSLNSNAKNIVLALK